MEIAKNLMHLLDPSTPGDHNMQVSQSVRILDTEVFDKIEMDIREFEQQQQQSDSAISKMDALTTDDAPRSTDVSASANASTSGSASTSVDPSVDNVMCEIANPGDAVQFADATPNVATPGNVVQSANATRDVATSGNAIQSANTITAESHTVAVDAIAAGSHQVAVDTIAKGSHPVAANTIAAESHPVAANTIAVESHPVAVDTTTEGAHSVAVNATSTGTRPVAVDATTAESNPVSVNAISTESHPVAVNAISADSHPVAVNAISTDSHPVTVDTTTTDIANKTPVVTVQCTQHIKAASQGVVINFPSASTTPKKSQYQRAVFNPSKSAELDANAKKIVEEVVTNAEKEDEDLFTDDEDDDIPEGDISTMTQKEKKKQREPISSQMSEETALDEIAKPTSEDAIDAKEGENQGTEMGNGGNNDEENVEEEGETDCEDENEDATAVHNLEATMKNADAEVDEEEIEPEGSTSTSKQQFYADWFASDDEGTTSNLRLGPDEGTTSNLRLGPVNGVKSDESRPKNGVRASELRAKAKMDSSESSDQVLKSVHTPSNPLIPDTTAKKQTTIVDQFARVVGVIHGKSSSSAQQQHVAQNASASGNALQQGAPNSATDSSRRQSPGKENVSGDPAAVSRQLNASKSPPATDLPINNEKSPSAKNGNAKSPLKRKSTGAYKFAPPKVANIDLGSTSSDLPLVKKAAAPNKKSKNLLTALPWRLGNKVCEFCFKPFLGRHKPTFTIREHIVVGNCPFVKQNCSSIGVDKTCNQCEKSFEYSKGMFQEIISHLCDENHEVICYLCGLRFQFSEIFSHMSEEFAKFFEPGVPCSKCKTVMNTASDFYNHIKNFHSAKEVNASVFNRFLFDSHPKYNQLLVSLMLTHSAEKLG